MDVPAGMEGVFAFDGVSGCFGPRGLYMWGDGATRLIPAEEGCVKTPKKIAGIEGVLEDQPETAKDADETGETGETGETEEPTRDTADFLLNWTFRSVEGDGILHAVPMCAPYSAIVESPYRAKLTPGKMKKGAMAKSVLEGWIKSATNEMEKKALKQIPMQDLISVIINNSRVAVSGAKGKKCSVC